MAQDTNALLRAAGAGNLTADETLTDFELLPMTQPMYLHVLVPAVSASDSLVVTADFENVSGTTLMQSTLPSITAAGLYTLPIFCDKPTVTDLSVILDVTLVGSAAGNFGAVEVWLSTSPQS
jgi:hypothetical protein